MNTRSAALAALAALMAGCSPAKLSSTLPATAPAASYVGVGTGALSAAAAAVEVEELQKELRRIARRADAGPRRADAGAVEFSLEGPTLMLRLGAHGSFGTTGAQLQPAALEFYAQLAAVLKARPGTVAHILVSGEAGSGEPATELSARRASSVQTYLAACGVPGTRLRAEGRRGERETIELVIKPVVVGAETQAWVPPS
jgi:outer membrane protein OmpA-like peptidoglycan-associated protein